METLRIVKAGNAEALVWSNGGECRVFTLGDCPVEQIIGKRVVPNLPWGWGQQGGPNAVGTVMREARDERGWVRVVWDNGQSNDYQWGANDLYDLKVLIDVPQPVPTFWQRVARRLRGAR